MSYPAFSPEAAYRSTIPRRPTSFAKHKTAIFKPAKRFKATPLFWNDISYPCVWHYRSITPDGLYE